jgi:hypothetical protein
MLMANYFSSILGIVCLPFLNRLVTVVILGNEPLYRTLAASVVLILASLLLSYVFELPFVKRIAPVEKRAEKVTKLACLIAQMASYGVLVPYYAYSSQRSVFTKAHLVQTSLSDANRRSATVYYLG